MYKFVVTTENLDKLVESLVETVVSEHDIETQNNLSRFGHNLTLRQVDIYKVERNMELRDKLRKYIHGTVGHLTSGYKLESDSWTEWDLHGVYEYRCYTITVLNPSNYPIKKIGFKEVVY